MSDMPLSGFDTDCTGEGLPWTKPRRPARLFAAIQFETRFRTAPRYLSLRTDALYEGQRMVGSIPSKLMPIRRDHGVSTSRSAPIPVGYPRRFQQRIGRMLASTPVTRKAGLHVSAPGPATDEHCTAWFRCHGSCWQLVTWRTLLSLTANDFRSAGAADIGCCFGCGQSGSRTRGAVSAPSLCVLAGLTRFDEVGFGFLPPPDLRIRPLACKSQSTCPMAIS